MSTTTGYNGKTVNRFYEDTAQQATGERETIWGELPGEIVSFDPVTQKAVVQPLYKPKHNGATIILPPLEEVPVRFDRVAGGAMTYPVAPGDRVHLRPIMRNTENFHFKDDFEANDSRSFSLSDMEAYLAGGEPVELNPIPNFDPLNAHRRFDELGAFGFKSNTAGQIAVEMTGGELLQILIAVLGALATETALTNTAVYTAAAGQLTASKITV